MAQIKVGDLIETWNGIHKIVEVTRSSYKAYVQGRLLEFSRRTNKTRNKYGGTTWSKLHPSKEEQERVLCSAGRYKIDRALRNAQLTFAQVQALARILGLDVDVESEPHEPPALATQKNIVITTED